MGAVEDFRALLAPGAIRVVFQPIVRLGDLATIGYEGLARFPTPPGLVPLPPDVMLAAGARYGLRDDMELACWSAIAAAGAPPHGRLLWVNLSPEALGHPGLLELAGRLPARLVIELTEQDTVLNNALLRERLRPWIARGALVAVDDAGAGFTSLEYVAELRPDFLKLSRDMVMGVDGDVTRQAVLRATAAFAREVGARIVAEGVERVEELEALRAMDIDYGQGYLFGRPGDAWPAEAPGAPVPGVFPAAEESPGAFPALAAAARLDRDLGRACDAREASAAVADHLARRGLLPVVYLAAGGRLRCQAARGSWQVYDGLPVSAGVAGRVFRSGVAAVIEDVGEAPDYLPAVPGVRAEVAVPLTAAGEVVGVLDCVALTAVDAAAVAEIERCAALLSAQLEQLGAVRPQSPAARLARLVGCTDLVGEALSAALDLSGYESGLVALTDDRGALYTHVAHGPFTVAFSDLSSEELAAMAAWVDEATCTYTVGDTAGRGFNGHETLRRAGAASLIVLPLVAGGTRLGLLAVADRANRAPSVETIEFLELLALQVAAGLPRESTSSLDSLPERAGVVIVDAARATDVEAALRAVAWSGGATYQTSETEFVVALTPDRATCAQAVGAELRALLGVPVGVAVGVVGEPGAALLDRARGALI